MPKSKRKSDSENVAAEESGRSKAKRGKGLRTGVATLTIGAAAFGAYYSPHFRAASSVWLERCREILASRVRDDISLEKGASSDDKVGEMLAQAPSFRDFLTDEYGEEGARELLGSDAFPTNVPTLPNAGGGFADYVVAGTEALEQTTAQGVASDFDAPSFPSSPESGTSFADYVAAETPALESVEGQPVADDVASSKSAVSEFGLSFADYVAAESSASENDALQDLAVEGNAPTESDLSFTVAGASNFNADVNAENVGENVEKTRLASPVFDGDEAALAARLQDEMKARGVGNPRIERWGERFWRASGFATTEDGVATFCEAVDVDPTAAQRAALAKFEAASF
ncbi:MAG: hypothetical protein IKY61_00455 [Thermoguttaceae bacterium]|nr:hypothetical protein [Thermoguttaceae bacterium]